MNEKKKLVDKFFNPAYHRPIKINDHCNYGGEIRETDFCTDYNGRSKSESSYAGRILSDWRFDEQCRRNINQRENMNCSNK